MKEHNLKIRVYAEDLDSFGIVHHANFIKFLERGRTDWLLSQGFAVDKLAEKGIIFPVRSMQLEYLKPARFNYELNLVTRVKTLGRASITFQQHIYTENLPPILLCYAEIKVACVNQDLRPCPLPKSLMEAICDDY